ncbi:MAG: ribosomal protein S18-alanine N-acetyltransferase [Wenzhouxiangellaceae bacterium]|nr:ribosomal protein S18-alanine N-acetyltransferase [Wenzhouxiangellaceae bacterium]
MRAFTPADLDGVLKIEQQSYPYPWSRGIFADCLRIGYTCRLLEDGPDAVGYSVLSVAAGEAHLLNLCVASAHRRQGFARLLLHDVLTNARLRGAGRLFLEVRPSNQGALSLYRSHGFRSIGRRPDYYPAAVGREDALVMVRHLDRVDNGLD